MTRIAIIHNIVTPYRLPLFEKLSRYDPSNDLTVFYCTDKYRDRLWGIKLKENYSTKILDGYTIDLPIINLPCTINKSIHTEFLKKGYDVIVISGFTDITTLYSLVYCKSHKIPIILWSELTGNYINIYGNIYNKIIKLLVNLPDAIIVPSSIAKNFHEKMGVSPNKMFIMPNSSDVESLTESSKCIRSNKEEYKSKLNITSKNIILFTGRLIERKGVIYLLEAYKNYKKMHNNTALIIVGEGPTKQMLVDFCKNEDIPDVYFVGFVKNDELIIYYSIADVFVLPSTWELHPLVLSEAMSCGLPVITTDSVANAFDMIVSGKNGYIVQKGKAKEIEDALEMIFCNINSMSEFSIEYVNSNFSLSTCAIKFMDAINSVIKK